MLCYVMFMIYVYIYDMCIYIYHCVLQLIHTLTKPERPSQPHPHLIGQDITDLFVSPLMNSKDVTGHQHCVLVPWPFLWSNDGAPKKDS